MHAHMRKGSRVYKPAGGHYQELKSKQLPPAHRADEGRGERWNKSEVHTPLRLDVLPERRRIVFLLVFFLPMMMSQVAGVTFTVTSDARSK